MSGTSLLERVEHFIEDHTLIDPGSTIIVGLSGGPDSAFLLHSLVGLAHKKKLTLIAAHLDHQWRETSANDITFCAQLSASLGFAFISNTIQELSLPFSQNGSKEEFGRKARRFFLEKIAREYNAQAIALGHHFDDQIETFFIRLIRGTSLAGLIGIKPKDGLYIRPLLAIKKNEIMEYLTLHDKAYLTDPSNESDEFLRNRIRASVVPALRACDQRFDNNFAVSQHHLQQTHEFIQELSATILKEISDDTALFIEPLLSLHLVILHTILMQWLIMHKVPFSPSSGFLDEIIRFLKQPGDADHIFYQKWRITKRNGKATINSIK